MYPLRLTLPERLLRSTWVINMKERKITCIMCPKGCGITVSFGEDGSVSDISGNSCQRGHDYAWNEVHHPVRTLTSTVRTAGGKIVAVKSSVPVPKELLFDIMSEINNVRPQEPVSFGCVLIENVCGTGADIVATSEC